MPAKKKATDTVENTPVNSTNSKAKPQIIEVDEETRVVSTPTTKASKSKTPVKEVATKAKAAAPTTKVAQAKAPESKQVQAKTTTAKPKKEKLPKPVTVTRLELAAEVAKAVSQHMEITGQESEAIVSEIIHSMIDGLKEGNKIEIRGFGAFRLRSRRARMGRNPKTGAKVEVAAKTVVYFKLGKELKEILLRPTETNKASTTKVLASLPTAEPAKTGKATKPAKATKQK